MDKQIKECGSYIRHGDCSYCNHYISKQYAKGWMHIRYYCELGINTEDIDKFLAENNKMKKNYNLKKEEYL